MIYGLCYDLCQSHAEKSCVLGVHKIQPLDCTLNQFVHFDVGRVNESDLDLLQVCEGKGNAVVMLVA